VVLAEYLDWLIRRFSFAIEFRQTSFARCHSNSPSSHKRSRAHLPKPGLSLSWQNLNAE
jgi:hypothetical protein